MFNFKKAVQKVFGIGRVQKSVKRPVVTPQAGISLGAARQNVIDALKAVEAKKRDEDDALIQAREDFLDYIYQVFCDGGYYDDEELIDACKLIGLYGDNEVGLSVDDFLSIDKGEDFKALVALIDYCTCGSDATITGFETRLKTAVDAVRKGDYQYYDVGNYPDLGWAIAGDEIPPEYESYVDWYAIGKDWADDNGAYETRFGFIANF